MELKVYKLDGSESGETINLPEEVFELENPNEHLIYQAVRTYLSNQRQGTHKTKERDEVRGGGKKPFRQKGTGNARRGTSRSPLMVGGGTIFGPRPHTYKLKLPKKSARIARKSALSLKAKGNEIMIVEDFSFESPKTLITFKFLTETVSPPILPAILCPLNTLEGYELPPIDPGARSLSLCPCVRTPPPKPCLFTTP